MLAELGRGFFFAGDFEGDLRGLGGYSSSIEAEEEGDEGRLVSSTSGSASASASEEEPSSSVSSPKGTGGAP